MPKKDQEAPNPEELEAEADFVPDEVLFDEVVDEVVDEPVDMADVDEIGREAELEQELVELKDKLLRAIAEHENYRKRTDREREQTRKFGISNFAKDLLGAADNLGRALQAGPDDLDGADDAVRNLIIGVQMTERELLSAFEKHGVRKIDPLGEKFDHNFHQAMMEVENSGQEPGVVVQVLQPGYAIEDRVLRAAMVGIAKGLVAEIPEHLDTTA